MHDNTFIFDSDSVETENDQCSETGSVFGSLNGDIERVDDFESSEESCLPGDSQENETRDDKPTLAGSCNSSSLTKKNNEMNNETDNDDVDDDDTAAVTNLQTLTNKFKNVSLLDPKSKSNYYEKKSQGISEASEDVQIEIMKVLSGKKNPVECSDCARFFEGEKGLRMHHKNSS
ncbi:hypothetical protein BpHYR1_034555 [Brachionus plicatilis]|uniref:C2H2-type domain-containing protein n=1 Tax=Brachionus plicatilis TaxID=10195 RepID=A0A3M7R0X1_BRAPC|nr:hypothetical protein BpHYR1_034555 [Brachionus plicatilis]